MIVQHYSTKRRKEMNRKRLQKKADKVRTWVRVAPLTKEQFEDGLRRARIVPKFETSIE